MPAKVSASFRSAGLPCSAIAAFRSPHAKYSAAATTAQAAVMTPSGGSMIATCPGATTAISVMIRG
jgi:hypothetical protein